MIRAASRMPLAISMPCLSVTWPVELLMGRISSTRASHSTVRFELPGEELTFIIHRTVISAGRMSTPATRRAPMALALHPRDAQVGDPPTHASRSRSGGGGGHAGGLQTMRVPADGGAPLFRQSVLDIFDRSHPDPPRWGVGRSPWRPWRRAARGGDGPPVVDPRREVGLTSGALFRHFADDGRHLGRGRPPCRRAARGHASRPHPAPHEAPAGHGPGPDPAPSSRAGHRVVDPLGPRPSLSVPARLPLAMRRPAALPDCSSDAFARPLRNGSIRSEPPSGGLAHPGHGDR